MTELTTPWIRIAKRLTSALKGAGWAALVLGGALAVGEIAGETYEGSFLQCHALVVEFKYAEGGRSRGAGQIAALEPRGEAAYDGRVMARLYLSGGAERAALLPQEMREALAPLDGDAYGK
ncbi:hypothetical protein [Streptosporangium sandarakinum]|uniref:hypothetical protein n=1 Tax=Streptosporangium sandarakinum TaxID=1260955 RepID=UPI0037238D29